MCAAEFITTTKKSRKNPVRIWTTNKNQALLLCVTFLKENYSNWCPKWPLNLHILVLISSESGIFRLKWSGLIVKNSQWSAYLVYERGKFRLLSKPFFQNVTHFRLSSDGRCVTTTQTQLTSIHFEGFLIKNFAKKVKVNIKCSLLTCLLRKSFGRKLKEKSFKVIGSALVLITLSVHSLLAYCTSRDSCDYVTINRSTRKH